MNLETITIQDCLDMYGEKNQATVINDGKVVGFVAEK